MLAKVDLKDPRGLQQLIELHAEKQGLTAQVDRAEALALVERFVKSPRADQLAKARHLLVEVEFLLGWPIDSGDGCSRYLQGYLDCLYQDASGRWHVVDYKTNRMVDGKRDELVTAYELQMVAYGLAAEQALGEPPADLVLHFLQDASEHVFPWNDAVRRARSSLSIKALTASAAENRTARWPACWPPGKCRMSEINADKQQAFALDVVRQLRAVGYEAYWAGGCVRDQLMGRSPKDYDVATSAVPEEIQKVFGRSRKTLAVGAAFGVIAVVGPRGAGQIDVATFREDVSYSDGRRPDAVRFTNAREDALRRDFSINGMFFDPISKEVLDFVGGQEDLRQGIIRAIGNPHQRFTEDKLRMLRAVRFAAYFGFSIEPATFEAICTMARGITAVSAERIANEMRMMLARYGRRRAIELLLETGLLELVLPEAVPKLREHAHREQTLTRLDALVDPSFPLSLAVLLSAEGDDRSVLGSNIARRVAARWRLSNEEADRTDWLLENRHALASAADQPWSRLQPVLVHEGAAELLTMTDTAAAVGLAQHDDVEFSRVKLALPSAQLNPPPLMTGDDLIQLGIPQGKAYARLLRLARDAQLDAEIQTRDEAIELVRSEYDRERS